MVGTFEKCVICDYVHMGEINYVHDRKLLLFNLIKYGDIILLVVTRSIGG